MKAKALLVAIFVLLLAVLPAVSCAQEVYDVNLQEVLDNYGLGENERIVKVNVEPAIVMHDPLVIMGNGVDYLERQGFDIFTGSNPVDPGRVLQDNVRSFEGQNIESYDLIVVGGPEQNAYTRELLDRRILTYGTTDLKMPGMVIEEGTLPGGRKVLVVSDVTGYPFHNKDLPLNGILPEKYAGVAAVVFGLALGLVASFGPVNAFLSSWWDKIWNFIWGYLTSHASEVASEKETEARKVEVAKGGKAVFLGYTAKEILAAIASALLFGIAFVIADRLSLLPANVLLYILTGGFVLVAHDFGHRLVAYFLKVDSEFQFWGLGTIVMLLTAWLFGLAFAQPGRSLVEKGEAQPRKLAIVTLAGPAISLLLSILFLPLIFFGGVVAEIGLLGFTMNLVTVVYNLMPFNPMDGKIIFDWSKLFWLLLFAPVFIFFVVMTYFVLG